MILTIETTVQQETKLDIPVPFFARRKNGTKYLGVLDEKTVVTLFIIDKYSCVTNGEIDSTEKRLIAEAWNEPNIWTTCTETEFLEKYDAVIESISLHPKLAV